MRFIFLFIILVCLFAKSSIFLTNIHHVTCAQIKGVIKTSNSYYNCEITISNYDINKIEKIKSFLDNINKHVFNFVLAKKLTYRKMKLVREIPSKVWRIYMKIIEEKIQELKIFNKN